MLASGSGRPLGVRVSSNREGPVREWLVDHGHVRKGIKILKEEEGKKKLWGGRRKGGRLHPPSFYNQPFLLCLIV
jgi:hypothetical protein